MTDPRLRHLRIWVPIGEFVIISLVLFPWMNATASDGPQDGRTWSWNVLGLPLVPGLPALLIWFASVAVICGATWMLVSSSIRRRITTTTSPA